MVPTFSTGQPLQIDTATAEYATEDLPRLLHGGEKGGAGILHQVPAIRDLRGLWAAFGGCLNVSGAAVTRDDRDGGLLGQPLLQRCRLTIRQEVDDAVPLQVADNRAIAVTAPPCPIINTDDAGAGTARRG